MSALSLPRVLAACVLVAALAPPVAAEDRASAPPITRTFQNGLRVVVFEDHRVPLVHVSLVFPGGVAAEPVDASGVANLTAQMIRLGTSSRDAAMFAAAVDQLGATFTAGAGREHSTVSISGLAEDLDAQLELLADAVLRPRFPDEEFDGFRRQAMGAVFQLRQSPLVVAEDHVWRAVFGDHPYGRPVLGTPTTLAAMTSEQVRAYHRDHYRPRGATLMVQGDVTPAAAFESALRMFGEWEGTVPGAGPPAAPASLHGVRVRIVDVPGATRAELRVGMLGAAHRDPRLPALQLTSEIVGGPAGVLDRALPKSGARMAVAALREGGLVIGAASVPLDSAAAGLDRLLGELAHAGSGPPAVAELERARRRLLGSMPFQTEAPSDRMAEWWTADAHGIGREGASAPGAALATVDPAAVESAARQFLTPGAARIVAVGPADALRPLLERFGPVEVVPLIETAAAAPASEPEPAELTAAQRTKGLEIVRRMLRAHGGTERLRSLRDSWIEADLVMSGRGAEMSAKVEQLRKEPDKFVYTTRMLDIGSRQVLNGDSAWTALGDSIQTHGTDEVALLRQLFVSDLPHVLLAAADDRHVAGWLREDVVGERRTNVVLIRVEGQPSREYHVDAQNGQLLAVDEREAGRQQVIGRRLFRDFRTVSGILWAHEEERLIGGERVMTMYMRAVRLNAGIGDGVFARPTLSPLRMPR